MSSVKVTNIAHPSASGNNIVLDSGGGATFSQITGGAISSGTSVASTSGTSIDFTGIPSWVKRITLMLDGVSTNGTNGMRIQLGTGGTPTTSGYLTMRGDVTTTNNTTRGAEVTNGFTYFNDSTSQFIYGNITFVNVTSNTWTGNGVVYNNGNSIISMTAGKISLSGKLDILRVTTASADTFDAGTINILYEG